MTTVKDRPNAYFFRKYKNGEAEKFLGNSDETCWLYTRYAADWVSAHCPWYLE